MPAGFCTLCGHVISSFEGITRCPGCGTDEPPCLMENQLVISINIRELQILGMWAMRYAQAFEQREGTFDLGECQQAVQAIVERLRKQLPRRLQNVPLTSSDAPGKLGA